MTAITPQFPQQNAPTTRKSKGGKDKGERMAKELIEKTVGSERQANVAVGNVRRAKANNAGTVCGKTDHAINSIFVCTLSQSNPENHSEKRRLG